MYDFQFLIKGYLRPPVNRRRVAFLSIPH